MKTKILQPDDMGLKQAVQLIKAGEVVAFATETVYGIFGTPERLFALKGREAKKPLTLHISDKGQIFAVAKNISIEAERLMEAFMPGAITLVFDAKNGGTIGVRFPDGNTAKEIIAACGGAVFGTSANISNMPSPVTAQEVFDYFGGRIPLILDGGTTKNGVASTVVDMTATPPKILRHGAISRQEIEEMVGEVN